MGSGGATKHMITIGEGLLREGYDIHFLCCYKNVSDFPYPKEFKIHYLTTSEDEIAKTRTKDIVKKTRKILKENRFDYIFTWFDLTSQYVALAQPFNRKNHICMIPLAPLRGELKSKRNKLALHNAKYIILQNNEQLSYFEKYAKKCHIIFNPISNDYFTTPLIEREKIQHFVTIGRIHRFKNLSMSVTAFSEIIKNNSNITFSIYGYDEQKEKTETHKIEEIIKTNHMESNIFLKGKTLDPKETLQHYDAFVLASTVEGMPNSLIEAMAISLPCIATRCPTGPETLLGHENNRGILVEMNNINEMVNAINSFINNPKYAMECGHNARTFIEENCKEEVVIKQFNNLLD
jgi:glycosyltransferase involved in cell wall biosynthesis